MCSLHDLPVKVMVFCPLWHKIITHTHKCNNIFTNVTKDVRLKLTRRCLTGCQIVETVGPPKNSLWVSCDSTIAWYKVYTCYNSYSSLNCSIAFSNSIRWKTFHVALHCCESYCTVFAWNSCLSRIVAIPCLLFEKHVEGEPGMELCPPVAILASHNHA